MYLCMYIFIFINLLFDIIQSLEDLVTAVPWFGPIFSDDSKLALPAWLGGNLYPGLETTLLGSWPFCSKSFSCFP